MSTDFIDKRQAGVLLHLTSLPSRTLEDTERWLDFMQASGLKVWQMLPLGVPSQGLSPYQCLSAYAINPALFSDCECAYLHQRHAGDLWFEQYCYDNADWLDDYVLFIALREHLDGKPWFEWPMPLRLRDKDALAQARVDHADELISLKWEQYALRTHWEKIRRMAHARGISLFGDMPLFVALDSADVWAHRDLFLLDEEGQPTVVAGVPPDYFSETGQRWGNPHYDWDRMSQDGFQWWLRRLGAHFEWFDLVRIDHFRGLQAVWEIPGESDVAIDGHWVKVPGEQLLRAFQKTDGSKPLIAEDLGVITPEVEKLRKQFKLPGMSILQFSFDYFDDNPHKPKNITADRVVYTGTHDNDTSRGWFESLEPEEAERIKQLLGVEKNSEVVDQLIQQAFSTDGCLAIAPMQDFLNLGSEARMNIPGTIDHNWTWQLTSHHLLTPTLSTKIRRWVEQTSR